MDYSVEFLAGKNSRYGPVVANVSSHDFHIGDEPCDIAFLNCRIVKVMEVIHYNHAMILSQKPLHYMRTNKPCAACHQDIHVD